MPTSLLHKFNIYRNNRIKYYTPNKPFSYIQLSIMSKRKRQRPEVISELGIHGFKEEELEDVRSSLLSWYDDNKRDLPWRKMASVEDKNKRAYGVWVSEIMLQQTQVATVIDYYNKWMKKWPDVESLSQASVEEVNEAWSGLGYYSRGRRLYEGAVKVVTELGGNVPTTADDLEKKLPGVGKYTAGAIASIAFGQVTGLVDGNVQRVFCRLRAIGAEVTSNAVTDALWKLANSSVDPSRPGDYNQALMELGATVCTPKSPQCQSCPLSSNCTAYRQVEQEKQKSKSKVLSTKNGEPDIPDIECLLDSCKLCSSGDDTWDTSLGVQNYPRKDRKKAAREERTAVCVLQRQHNNTTHYLMVQRPEKGLLAGLWEFPSVTMDSSDASQKACEKAMDTYLSDSFALNVKTAITRQHHGEVVHLFSHIHQTYVVESVRLSTEADVTLESCERSCRWLSSEEIGEAAVSTAMKKVLRACENKTKKKAVKKEAVKDGKKQLSMDSFFKPNK